MFGFAVLLLILDIDKHIDRELETKTGTDMKYYKEISNIMNAFQKLRIKKALKASNKGSFQSSKRSSPSRVSLDSSMNQSSFHKSTGTKTKIKHTYKLKHSKIYKKPETQKITRNRS